MYQEIVTLLNTLNFKTRVHHVERYELIVLLFSLSKQESRVSGHRRFQVCLSV